MIVWAREKILDLDAYNSGPASPVDDEVREEPVSVPVAA